MGKRDEPRPLAVMMSKRANVFYLEHVRVVQNRERVMYLTETGQPVEQLINIPERNTAFLLLGRGCSITDAAVRRLAQANVMVGFCGSGGSPLIAAADPVFLCSVSEYRPTEYMQQMARIWFDEGKRLALARLFLRERAANALKAGLPASAIQRLLEHVESEVTVQALLSAEAAYAKDLYRWFAQKHAVEFSRKEGAAKTETAGDLVNSYLDHGNYLAYGYAACSLHTLGISFAFPVLHGKTRRGALVFDLADIIKDTLVMPLAFEYGSRGRQDNEFRAAVIEAAAEREVLDYLMTFLETSITEVLEKQ